MKEQLEVEMRKAATAQDYEKAAGLRDLIRDLKETTKKERKFERVPYTLPLAIDPQRDLTELAKALGLREPPRRIEGFDISNISGTFAVASLVSFKNGRPDRANYRRFKIKTVEGQDDFAGMAEVVFRRYSRLKKESQQIGDSRWQMGKKPRNKTPSSIFHLPSPNFPDLIMVDGGKGQLNAACTELVKLGLGKIPVIGLAKEFEEIYVPGESKPLRLGLNHPAVKLLQRIRDECHRVANSYNAQLRIKRISESVLDEFPGIGEQRKQALLKKFGSVQRLRTATLEQIAAVPGFGGKAAAELKAFLEARSVS